MTLAGLIFTNINDSAVPELTKVRSMASVPFGCRYRLIDFTLSNMSNSGIDNVGIVTHFNYQSLMDHVGNGKDWDLARRSAGIKILPPTTVNFLSSPTQTYSSRLEALASAKYFIERCPADYIVLSDSDCICNINYKKVAEEHVQSGADITMVTKKIHRDDIDAYRNPYLIKTDDTGRIVDIMRNPTRERDFYNFGGDEINISMHIFVMKPVVLASILEEARAKEYKNLYTDILLDGLANHNFRTYEFDGYYSVISSLASYFEKSMEMLNEDSRRALFGNKAKPIMTKVRNSSPSIYADEAQVKNSLIADGCVIEGTVENSILFRGVKVGKGSVIKNSILLQNTSIDNGVTLNCVVSDKDVTISSGVMLSGHASMPFYIAKGKKI